MEVLIHCRIYHHQLRHSEKDGEATMNQYKTLIEMDKRIGLTVSSFDCLHAGHCTMLREAKEQCDLFNSLTSK